MEKISALLKKILTKEVLLYAVFGVFTTLVNLGSFFVMNSCFRWNENLSNFIAIALAVLFAYITNKDLVFHSEAKSFKDKVIEFFKFVAGRAFTMVVEFVGGFLLFPLCNTSIQKTVVKLFVTVIVIILNFFISKFFAFKKSKN